LPAAPGVRIIVDTKVAARAGFKEVIILASVF
jgi:hypothetical protein